jgi:dTDP-4-dehydrorhamnose reductase
VKIVILGSTGMLGHAVGHYFLKHYGENNVCLSYRDKNLSYGKHSFYFDCLESSLDIIPECDAIVNCIGVIKPFIKHSLTNAIKINALFPHQLANACRKKSSKLIHITTDCVFSGQEGEYRENAHHDCIDDYGKTKSLGEPSDTAMVLRTSIIGEELHKHASLIAWAKSQAGKTVNGFNNHQWNGMTTKQYAKVCQTILDQHFYSEGLYHLFSNAITKYYLLNLLNDQFNLNLTIENVKAPQKINRTLSTDYDLNTRLSLPTLESQIAEL